MKNFKKLGLAMLGLIAMVGCKKAEDPDPTPVTPSPTTPVGIGTYKNGSDAVTQEFDANGVKIVCTTVGQSGLNTLTGMLEEDFEFSTTTTVANAVAGTKAAADKNIDLATIGTDCIVYIAVEFTGKGAETIAGELQRAQDVVTASANWKGVVLVGLDGAKNRGAQTDQLWTVLLGCADKVIISNAVYTAEGGATLFGNGVGTSYTLDVVGGTSLQSYNGLCNAIADAYNELTPTK